MRHSSRLFIQGLDGDGRAALKKLVKAYGTPSVEITRTKVSEILRLKVSPFPAFVKEFENLYISLRGMQRIPDNDLLYPRQSP